MVQSRSLVNDVALSLSLTFISKAFPAVGIPLVCVLAPQILPAVVRPVLHHHVRTLRDNCDVIGTWATMELGVPLQLPLAAVAHSWVPLKRRKIINIERTSV